MRSESDPAAASIIDLANLTEGDVIKGSAALKYELRPAIVRRRGVAWGWRTQEGMRAFGIDFGRFALVVLLDPKEDARG